jgi:hypothetical protein
MLFVMLSVVMQGVIILNVVASFLSHRQGSSLPSLINMKIFKTS